MDRNNLEIYVIYSNMCWFLCCIKKPQEDLEEQLISQDPNQSAISIAIHQNIDSCDQNSKKIHQNMQMLEETINLKSGITKKISENNISTNSNETLPIIKEQDQHSPKEKKDHQKSSKKNYLKIDMQKSMRDRYKQVRKYSSQIPQADKSPTYTRSFAQQGTDNFQIENHQKYKTQTFIKSIFQKSNKLDYIYMNTSIEHPIYLVFKCKKYHDIKEPLQHYIDKNNNKVVCLIGKPLTLNSKIDFLRKSHETLQIINYDKQQGGVYQLSVSTHRMKCLIMKRMQIIIIVVPKLPITQQIQYVMSIINHLTDKQKKRVTLFFPSLIYTESIAQILDRIYGQQIFKVDTHKFVSQFAFSLDYFQNSLDTGVIIKLNGCENMRKVFYYNQIRTSLSVFGKNFNNQRYHFVLRQFYNQIKRRSVKDLILFKQIFRGQLKQYRQKIRQIRNWQNYELIYIENQKYLAHCSQKAREKYRTQLIVTQGEKDKILKFFEKDNKNEQNTPVNREWDDDLVQDEIKVPIIHHYEIPAHFRQRLDSLKNNDIEQVLIEHESMLKQLGLQSSEDQGSQFQEQYSSQSYYLNQVNNNSHQYRSQRKHSWDI